MIWLFYPVKQVGIAPKQGWFILNGNTIDDAIQQLPHSMKDLIDDAVEKYDRLPLEEIIADKGNELPFTLMQVADDVVSLMRKLNP
jgi:predicted Zn-dependent protease with MMP-like domain